jgi:hypothetical protein
VGGFRAAEYIANRYQDWSLEAEAAERAAQESLKKVREWIEKCREAPRSWNDILKEVRWRMSLAGSQIRSESVLEEEITKARSLVQSVMEGGCKITGRRELKHAFRTRHLTYAHSVYLQAIQFGIQSGVGSRGSSIVLDAGGEGIHAMLDQRWRIQPENPTFRARVLESEAAPDGCVSNHWEEAAAVPEADSWFETTWAEFREGKIY